MHWFWRAAIAVLAACYAVAGTLPGLLMAISDNLILGRSGQRGHSDMIPETFTIHHKRSVGGVLSGIFYHSASLMQARKLGKMPPLVVFNDFMSCGYDDLFRDTACMDVDDFEGGILEWEPFTLEPSEYEEFLDSLKKRGRAFEVVDYKTSSYSVWFTKCYETGRKRKK